jgi:hypothetical protein
MSANISVVPTTGIRKCKPFVLNVMVFAPEPGFKFEVMVEKSCTKKAEPLWKLVFDLYKKKKTGNDFDQIVHVSYTQGDPVEAEGIQNTAIEGVNDNQADGLITRVHPRVKKLENAKDMTPEELEAAKADIKKEMSAVAKSGVVSVDL